MNEQCTSGVGDAYEPNFDIAERKVRVAISPICNLKCEYCDHGAKRSKEQLGAMEDFRSTEISDGSMDIEGYTRAMRSLYNAGYSGIAFTGGEPLLNRNWPEIVKNAKDIGYKQVQLTTNAMLLEYYVEKNGPLPKELDLLTISLDTFDKGEFARITKGNIDRVIAGINAVRDANPDLHIKANKVVMRNNLPDLEEYIKLCEQGGAIKRLTLLNLICKDPFSEDEKTLFNEQFVSPQEIMEILNNYNFHIDKKYEYITTTSAGLLINLMDTDKTLRSEECENCPMYCQEGLFTARLATDGTIRTCSDFNNRLSYIQSPKLRGEELDAEVFRLLEPQRRTTVQSTLGKFCTKYGLNPRRLN